MYTKFILVAYMLIITIANILNVLKNKNNKNIITSAIINFIGIILLINYIVKYNLLFGILGMLCLSIAPIYYGYFVNKKINFSHHIIRLIIHVILIFITYQI